MAGSRRKFDFPLIAFIFVLILMVFLLGGVFAFNKWQPFKFINEGFKATSALVNELTRTRPIFLKKHRYHTDGVSTYDPQRANNGYTMLQGTLPGGTQIRLIDMLGNEIHRWPIDFHEIWPEPTHLEERYRPKAKFNYHTQGLLALPDGSVIINVGSKGTAKLSKCGAVEWTVDRMTHHSITPTGSGGYWIPSNRNASEVADHLIFPGVTRAKLMDPSARKFVRYENLVLLVDSEGVPIKEFSVLESLYQAGFEADIFDAMKILPSDPTHVNDIEIVTSALADKIESVEKGDLLLSLRQMHMLIIMDKTTGETKWHITGPWIRQHDPDITRDGNIVIFNNGSEKLHFNRIPGSNIIEIDPATRRSKILYPVQGEGFYSAFMGTHELLENGNRLIAETLSGRVFEVTPEGRIVWDYVKPYDELHASIIATAQRFNRDYFTVEDWNCE